MKILITGGSGLIGAALTTSLLDDGHQVIVLSRHPERAALPSGTRVERWDARSAQGWGALADGADAIVNLAGASLVARWTARRRRLIRDSRLNAGHAVVEAVEAAVHRPRVVVQASGTGYYGPHGDDLVVESAPPGTDFLGRTAVAWEASTAPLQDLGVRRAVARSGAVLSTSGGALPPLLLQFRLFAGGRLGDGRQWFPWIHIADEVRAIRFLIETEAASGAFNLVSPGAITNAAFSRALARVMRRPALLPVPGFALRLLLGQMSTVLLDGQRAVPERLLALGFTFAFSDVESALQDLLR